MAIDVTLRDVTEADLPIFFEHHLDPVANQVAVFGAKDPSDRVAFDAKWIRILRDSTVTKKTIICDGQIAGSVMAFLAPWSGKLEVSYWIDRRFWGRGVATAALSRLLQIVTTRPLHGRAAKDNVASIRVLQKCGFVVTGEEMSFSDSRGAEVDEAILELHLKSPASVVLNRRSDLAENDLAEIATLSAAVYPPETVANWWGRELEWSTAEWCVRVRSEAGRLVSYVGVLTRDATCDGWLVRIGGIGGVKTHPSARGRGFASTAILRAVDLLRRERSVAFSLLVCEPRLLDYYAHLGWREFGGRLLIQNLGKACEFTQNRVMTHGFETDAPSVGVIDLCGPPW
jgi:RimJ/RimL family protein N-acetyltransferase